MIRIFKILISSIFFIILLSTNSYAQAFTNEMCYLVAISQGTAGRAFVAIAVVATGIGFFFGKISFQVVIAIIVGVALFFGSESLVSLASGEGGVNCEEHIIEINTDYSDCMTIAYHTNTAMRAPSGVWTGVKYAEFGAVSGCKLDTTINCSPAGPTSVSVVTKVANECIGRSRCQVWVGPMVLGVQNPCSPGNINKLNVIMSYE